MKMNVEKYKLIWQLFSTFFKLGAFTFGGGYAMIPLIQKEVVDQKKWMQDRDILEIVAIAESTPGPIAVNAATFVGRRIAGTIGSVASTLGVVLPSFGIILVLSLVLGQFEQAQIVKDAFWGVRIGVLALIAKAFLTMLKQCPHNRKSLFIGIAVLLGVAVLGCNAIVAMMLAAAYGVMAEEFGRKRKK